MLFTVEMNYKASIVVAVEAEEEGQALELARDMAEDADIGQFVLSDELESRILKRG